MSSYWVEDLESKGLPPLLLTAIANSMFAVLLPVSFLSHYLYKRSSRNKWVEMTEDLSGSSQPQGALSRETKKAEREWTREKLRGLFLKALGLWPIWFLAIFAYNCSFLSTDVMVRKTFSLSGLCSLTPTDMQPVQHDLKHRRNGSVYLRARADNSEGKVFCSEAGRDCFLYHW